MPDLWSAENPPESDTVTYIVAFFVWLLAIGLWIYLFSLL